MNTYIAFWRDKELSVSANSTFEAQQKAALAFKCRKTWEVTVVLSAKQGQEVVHTADF